MSDEIPVNTTVSCNRRADRYRLPHSEQAWVEVAAPDGSRWNLPLLEISEYGLAFGAEPGFPDLPEATELTEAEIRVGKAVIRGTLRLEHQTTGLSTGRVYGASFHPAAEADREELRQLIQVLVSLHAAD